MSAPHEPEPTPTPTPTVELLLRIGAGDRAASSTLAERLQGELRALASAHLSGRVRRVTLQPTVLVNEAWIRLAEREALPFENRHLFLAFASKVMRGILVDTVRARGADKRGGGHVRVSLSEVVAADGAEALDLLAVDEALDRLAKLDPECAELVDLRFFGGLEPREIARVLGVSESTIDRRWRFARAWLQAQLAT
ncbi:MAG: ECF-type sigma factor [Planctomycetota bacterium]